MSGICVTVEDEAADEIFVDHRPHLWMLHVDKEALRKKCRVGHSQVLVRLGDL